MSWGFRSGGSGCGDGQRDSFTTRLHKWYCWHHYWLMQFLRKVTSVDNKVGIYQQNGVRISSSGQCSVSHQLLGPFVSIRIQYNGYIMVPVVLLQPSLRAISTIGLFSPPAKVSEELLRISLGEQSLCHFSGGGPYNSLMMNFYQMFITLIHFQPLSTSPFRCYFIIQQQSLFYSLFLMLASFKHLWIVCLDILPPTSAYDFPMSPSRQLYLTLLRLPQASHLSGGQPNK